MKLFLWSTDAVEIQLGMEMLAQAAIRYELRHDSTTNSPAGLWIREDSDFPTALALLKVSRSDSR